MCRTLSLILVITIIIAALSGCSNGIAGTNQEQPEISKSQTYEPKASGSQIYEPKILGNATFAVDDSKSASADYPADGTSVTLSVTDSNGLTWKLDIPEDALLQPERIKMTAMLDVNVGTLGRMAGGVVFEPDGLTYLSPAKLTVTGEGVTAKSLLLTGKQDGSNLTFTSCENKDGGVSADIFHFSTEVMPDFDQMAEAMMKNMTDLADQQKIDAVKYAKEILKRPIEDPPAPPDISLKCKKGTHYLDINQYLKLFLENLEQPEMSAIAGILGAERSQQLMGTSANEDDAYKMAAKLLDRLETKLIKVIEKYQSQPEKFYATCTAFMRLNKMYELVNGQHATDYTPLQRWCEKVAEYYLSELTDKHDYTTIHAVKRALSTYALIGGDQDKYLDKFVNALKFDLKIELNMRTVASYYFSYEITGTIPIELTLDKDLVKGDGSGTCEYTSVKCPIGQFQSPSSYPCNIKITKFDPCAENVVKISLDGIGAGNETWYYTLSGMTVTDEDNAELHANWLAGKLFAEEKAATYDFSTDLKNLNVNAVDQTIDKKATDDRLNLEGSLQLILVHKPNG